MIHSVLSSVFPFIDLSKLSVACLQGLLNGIDTALWDPATDPLIPAPYTPERLEGKALCKRYLQQGLGLDVNPEKPIIACITRLVPQKVHSLCHVYASTAAHLYVKRLAVIFIAEFLQQEPWHLVMESGKNRYRAPGMLPN